MRNFQDKKHQTGRKVPRFYKFSKHN